jgi:hypothetical protein
VRVIRMTKQSFMHWSWIKYIYDRSEEIITKFLSSMILYISKVQSEKQTHLQINQNN